MQLGEKCFLLTKRDVLMPATYSKTYIGDRGMWVIDVVSPDGRVYTCNPDNVFEEFVGKIMYAHRRAEQLAAQGYQIAVRNDGTFRVYQPRKHGETGGYIVREVLPGHCICNCPAHEESETCKHAMAVCSLLHNKAHNAEERGWKSGATRYEKLALRIAIAA